MEASIIDGHSTCPCCNNLIVILDLVATMSCPTEFIKSFAQAMNHLGLHIGGLDEYRVAGRNLLSDFEIVIDKEKQNAWFEMEGKRLMDVVSVVDVTERLSSDLKKEHLVGEHELLMLIPGSVVDDRIRLHKADGPGLPELEVPNVYKNIKGLKDPLITAVKLLVVIEEPAEEPPPRPDRSIPFPIGSST